MEILRKRKENGKTRESKKTGRGGEDLQRKVFKKDKKGEEK